MKTVKMLTLAVLVTIVSISCKKEQVIEATVPHNYTGKWKNVAKPPEGPLDFFIMKLQLEANYSGTSEFEYTSPVHTYPITKLAWEKLTGDSVLIKLDIPAYPDEVWELRGLANKTNTEFTAAYFSISKAKPSDKKKYGTMVFKH